MREYDRFTSESVSDGHPDKLADRISDAILDAVLEKDKEARVACETLIKSGLIVIAGEIGFKDEKLDVNDLIDVAQIARRVVHDTGYVHEDIGMNPSTCRVENELGKQSPEIKNSVFGREQGAGDQGMMFGYATEETEVLMPAPIMYAHLLMKRQKEVREKYPCILRPDAKCQLTFEYCNGEPQTVSNVVFSNQHAPDKEKCVKEIVCEEIIKKVIPESLLTKLTKNDYVINPSGSFISGGPAADCGLTGRKIIVDTYGGAARHGGGAFSGKDPSKVDRSAAYATRYVAKNIVAAGLAKRCEIQVSYAIGKSEPTSFSINTFGTEKGITIEKIIDRVKRDCFEFRPEVLIDALKLKCVTYSATAAFGHFGREEENFTWERTDLAAKLKRD